METTAEFPTNPPVKRVAAALIAVVLLTMGLLVWFNSKGIPPDPAITVRPDGAPPLLNFPFLDKVDYDAKGDDLQVSYPGELSALDGKKVALAGFMTPYESLDDMHDFLLMASSGGCFFCSPPSLSQVIMVHQTAAPGAAEKLPYLQEPIMVTGTLHLYNKGSKNAGHEAGFIFDLSDAQVSKISGGAAETAGLTLGLPAPMRR